MLSICIPIFNQDVTQLVKDLHLQAESLNIDYEILLFDDCSSDLESKIKNRKTKDISNVGYRELESNIGRSAIRNLLAEEAKYQYLIFMDCDTAIQKDDYLKCYLDICQPNIVCYGGCAYSKIPPSPDKYLRWYVGKKREERPASIRSKNAAAQFTAFNLLIDRNLILSCPFDERISQYGHEDTLLGIELNKLDAVFIHIDNSLIHTGLDITDVFLQKTKSAINNLVIIEKTNPSEDFSQSVRILRLLEKLNKFKLTRLFSFVLPKIENYLVQNLKGNNPKLFLFDLFKLNYLIQRKAN